MMAVHLVPDLTPTTGLPSPPRETWASVIASGRASALFAVLAGVALALAHGGDRPPTGPALAASRRAVAARGALVAAVGLTLGLRPGNVLVILVVYGTLFSLAPLALGLRAAALAVLGGAWLVLSPVVSQLLRAHLPVRLPGSPSWRSLAHPVRLVVEVVVTGAYPALTWTGYLLVGLAVGRLGAERLQRPRTAAALLAGGALGAAVAPAASVPLVRAVGGAASFLARTPASYPLEAWGYWTATVPATALRVGFRGTTPAGSWTWFALASPHSGTPLDLLATTGSALAVLGAVLLAGRARPVDRALVPLAAAGSMTLTLYCAHVLTAPLTLAALSPTTAWVVQAAAALAVGCAVAATGRRGPLEALAALVSRRAARGVATSDPPPELPPELR